MHSLIPFFKSISEWACGSLSKIARWMSSDEYLGMARCLDGKVGGFFSRAV
jgi:hypothetical protein